MRSSSEFFSTKLQKSHTIQKKEKGIGLWMKEQMSSNSKQKQAAFPLSVGRTQEIKSGIMNMENTRTEAHETYHHEGCAYRLGH